MFCQTVFDNSSGHFAKPPDGLNAATLLVGDHSDAKNIVPPSRNGWFMKDGVRVVHEMNTSEGQRKGMATILRERGVSIDGLKGDCALCKNENKRGFVDEVDTTRTGCCLRRIVSLQPDFVEQITRIEEYINERGHICIFLPKFHCELNWIEMFWGAVKRILRERCQYSFAGLKRNLPLVLAEVANDRELLWNFQTHVFKYIQAYHEGARGNLVIFAVKKYKGHRCLPEGWLADITKDYQDKYHEPVTVALNSRGSEMCHEENSKRQSNRSRRNLRRMAESWW